MQDKKEAKGMNEGMERGREGMEDERWKRKGGERKRGRKGKEERKEERKKKGR